MTFHKFLMTLRTQDNRWKRSQLGLKMEEVALENFPLSSFPAFFPFLVLTSYFKNRTLLMALPALLRVVLQHLKFNGNRNYEFPGTFY